MLPAPASTAEAERPVEEPYRPANETPAAPQAVGRRALPLALIALAVSLTAPFWEDSVLSAIGIRTPAGRTAEQSSLAVAQQERRAEDIAQRLAAATAQITKQQADFAAATRRTEQAATLIRTLALVRLSETLRRPMPFAAELAVVRASGADLGDLKPLLDQIEPYAATGIPGAAQLRQDFRALQDQVSHGVPATSWMTSIATWTRLRSAPRTPPQADPSPELLQSASARLADADFAGALEQTRQLSEAYKPVFANWNDDTQARVAADTIADRVSDMVTQSLKPPATK